MEESKVFLKFACEGCENPCNLIGIYEKSKKTRNRRAPAACPARSRRAPGALPARARRAPERSRRVPGALPARARRRAAAWSAPTSTGARRDRK